MARKNSKAGQPNREAQRVRKSVRHARNTEYRGQRENTRRHYERVAA